MKQTNSALRNRSHRLWLYTLVYPLHAIEEIRGVGAGHGINMSLTRFFVLIGVSWVMLIAGIALAKRLGYPNLMEIILATAVIANAISHIITTVERGYDPGVITGILIFIPIGAWTLISLRNSMRPLRYLAGVALGLLTQTSVMIISR